jgi:hypothetical protein
MGEVMGDFRAFTVGKDVYCSQEVFDEITKKVTLADFGVFGQFVNSTRVYVRTKVELDKIEADYEQRLDLRP